MYLVITFMNFNCHHAPPPLVKYDYSFSGILYCIIGLPSALFGLSPQNFSLKKFIFFIKKPDLKNFLIFSQKSFSNFQEMELSYIQNHNIFRT